MGEAAGSGQPPEEMPFTIGLGSDGVGVVPDVSLPRESFGTTCLIELKQPDGTMKECVASIEALYSTDEFRKDVFTYRLHGMSTEMVSPNSVIRLKEIKE